MDVTAPRSPSNRTSVCTRAEGLRARTTGCAVSSHTIWPQSQSAVQRSKDNHVGDRLASSTTERRLPAAAQ